MSAEAIRSIVRCIEGYPQGWNQAVIFSRSTDACCLASWTCLRAGMDLDELLTKDPDGASVLNWAQRILGLSDRQAKLLFHWGEDYNQRHPTVEQFKRFITAITGVEFENELTDEPLEVLVAAARS